MDTKKLVRDVCVWLLGFSLTRLSAPASRKRGDACSWRNDWGDLTVGRARELEALRGTALDGASATRGLGARSGTTLLRLTHNLLASTCLLRLGRWS